ncbi:MAG: S41 family peptidase [Treponema sp.]|nr:S41 family peptidase [Treponema sp.]
MKSEDFKRIYIDSKKREYSPTVLENVKKCMIPFESINQFIPQGKIRRKISIDQAVSDVNVFFDCMRLLYSGYDYFFTDELSSQIQNNLINKLKQKLIKHITNEKLCRYLFQALRPFIHESHMDFISGHLYFSFAKPYIAYVSNVVVIKKDKCYQVVKGDKIFKINQIFKEDEIKDYLLPTLCPDEMKNKDDEFFLLGMYANKKIRTFCIKNKKIKVHRIKCDFAEKDNKQNLVEHDNYVVVNHPSYLLEVNQEKLDEFSNEGRICSKKQITILNVAGNYGGNDYFPRNFFTAFAGSDYQNLKVAKIDIQEGDNSVKQYEIIDLGKDKSKGEYNGQLFVVMNKSTASSGEAPVAIAKNITGAIIVGSASSGCGTFGDCLSYQLPNSKIYFRLGYKLFYYDNFEEGKGWIPDFWIDDKNPVNVLEKYISIIS